MYSNPFLTVILKITDSIQGILKWLHVSNDLSTDRPSICWGRHP